MGSRTIRTEENRQRFIEGLNENGNVTQVCRALDLHRPAIYAWKKDDPSFAREWEDALALGVEGLEDEARRRAIQGSDLLLIFLLKGAKPEKYAYRSQVDVNNNITVDFKKLPREELIRRLEQLRLEQQPTITSTVVDMTGAPVTPTDED
jgi:hypothetical protein